MVWKPGLQACHEFSVVVFFYSSQPEALARRLAFPAPHKDCREERKGIPIIFFFRHPPHTQKTLKHLYHTSVPFSWNTGTVMWTVTP